MSAAQEILAILEAERCRVKKRIHLADSIIGTQD